MNTRWITTHLGAFLIGAACLSGLRCSHKEVAPPVPDETVVVPVATGFRVLVVEETDQRTKLPASQQGIFTSASVREYLKAHCADEGQAFRFLDKDALTGEWKSVADSSPAKSLPWLYVTSGKAGYSGPLPQSVDAFMATIKPYAEPK